MTPQEALPDLQRALHPIDSPAPSAVGAEDGDVCSTGASRPPPHHVHLGILGSRVTHIHIHTAPCGFCAYTGAKQTKDAREESIKNQLKELRGTMHFSYAPFLYLFLKDSLFLISFKTSPLQSFKISYRLN